MRTEVLSKFLEIHFLARKSGTEWAWGYVYVFCLWLGDGVIYLIKDLVSALSVLSTKQLSHTRYFIIYYRITLYNGGDGPSGINVTIIERLSYHIT